MKRLINLVISIILLVGMLPVVPAVAQTCLESVVVTTIADSGEGSLRQAIVDVCSGGTVTFDVSLSGATIVLDSQLTLGKDLTIDGSTLPSKVTISGNALTRVFWINSGKTVTLDSLIVVDGSADDYTIDGPSGGGIYNDGTLTIKNSVLYNNNVSWLGGGVYNNYDLTIMNSVIEGNSAVLGGGGVHNNLTRILTVKDSTIAYNSSSIGGGLYNEGQLTLSGSTLIGNRAEGSSYSSNGGGIYNYGTATVANCTFTQNFATLYGSGIYNFGAMTLYNSTLAGNSGSPTLVNTDATGRLNFANTIIADTTGSSDCLNSNGGVIVSNYHNLVEDGSCSAGAVNYVSGDPMLAALADNGGLTLTMALLPGSPAIDAGDNTICAASPVDGLDQRGVTRPQNEFCDIGAYEQLEFDILPHTLPPATVGFHYSQQLTAVGGTPPYSWSSSGLIEVPFTLYNETGMLMSDDNAADPHTPGVITFTAIWHDSTDVDFSKEYSLTVFPALVFSPGTLPTGKVGEVYSQVVTLSGGLAPYTIDPVSIPSWLTYDVDSDAGTITLSGTPTEHGSFSVEIQASDALGVKGKKTYGFWIGPERAFSWSPENPNQFEGVNFAAISDLGSTSLNWWRGDNPGDTCDTYVSTITNNLYAVFNESGSYQICMDYWINSINGYVRDQQWVTINNVPPKDVYITFIQEPAYINNPVYADIRFIDWDIGPFTCTIDWGDGSDPQTMPADPDHECEFPEHIYPAADTYTVTGYVTEEGVGSSESITRNLEVLDPASLPPEAWDGEWLVGEVGHSRIRLEAFDLQGNDDLSFEVVDPPVHGTVTTPVFEACEYDEDGSGVRVCSAVADYTPDISEPPYNGSDTFTFTASDAGLTSDPATISLVIAPNEAPKAYGDNLTVVSTIPTTIELIAKDPDVVDFLPDKLEIEIISDPVLGTLDELIQTSYEIGFNGETGKFEVTYYWIITYTPDGSTGADSFEFQVTDNNYHTSTAIIDLTVQEPITWHVNTFDDIDNGACDSTHCSLREAVHYAISGDSIDFEGLLSELPGTIVLSGEQIRINKDLTIIGPGADQLAISGNDVSRVISVSGYEIPVIASISGLTIKDGWSFQGGGVALSEGSSLTMTDCVIGPGNIVAFAGGGIFNDGGHLILNRCTVTGNEGTGTLGGAGVTTAYNDATTTLINSTISGNITNNYGGGIFVGNDCVVKLIHTTVSGNLSNADFEEPGEERGGGAGIYIDPTGNGQLEIQNSIVAGNTDMTDPATAGHAKWLDVYGSFESHGGNLIGDPTGSTNDWAASDLVGTAETPLDPLLGALVINSPGHTPTMALLEGSPAIDAAPSCTVTIDQRGITRPQGSSCDIGAYELEQEPIFWEVFMPLIISGSAD
ncbi:MAG: choice-of-anchor Q domain-containing protein [Brevefilum sp.]|nr:choice-of-anchor Q domain-containing protein [Brevefilum sp.]